MLGAIVFVTQSEKGCSQVNFDSEYKYVSSLCSFSYLGIYRQGFISYENQRDKFDMSATQKKKRSVKIRTSKFIFMFMFSKERKEYFSRK
jgi:hypothetical protein